MADVTRHLFDLCRVVGIIFTLDLPLPHPPFSTLFIRRTDALFREYGSFVGLAEQIDIGNTDSADKAFVFADVFGLPDAGIEPYISTLSQIVARESGKLVGYANLNQNPDAGQLDPVATTYEC